MNESIGSQSSPFPRKATLALNFVIVGGSIAGLACAYNLQQAGHSVRVLEKDDAVGKSIGGVRSPPNMTRLLFRWGLGERLKRVSNVCSRIAFRLGTTMEFLSALVFHKEVMRALEADVLLLHHADLHEMLYELALNAGVMVDFNSEVVAVDPYGPSITLASGKRICADIIVGADGGQSMVRPVVSGKKAEEKIGPYAGYAFSIAMDLIEKDPELTDLVADISWNIFMCDNRCILTHLARGGDKLGVSLIISDGKLKTQPGWTTIIPLSALDFERFDPRLQRLMKMAPSAIQTRHVIQEKLEDWYHPSGNVLIIGEAAHLLNPGGTHGASMAIEDAAVLGSLFSRLQNRHQIRYFLSAFQDLRQDRCEAVISSEYDKVEFPTLPAGPIQEARDSGLREQGHKGILVTDLDDVSEDYLREQCEEFRNIFGYDAYDEADTWWVEWGSLLVHAVARPVVEDFIAIQTTEFHTENDDIS